MWYRIFSSLSLVLALGACSDSDSDSDSNSTLNEKIAVGGYGNEIIQAGDVGNEGHLVTSRMSMVASDQVSDAMLKWQPVDISSFPENSDYKLDMTQTWINENTLDVLQQVNEILCQINQAGYDRPEVINQGPYLAQIDVNQCQAEYFQDDKATGDLGVASAQYNVPEYEFWTVESLVSNNPEAPQVVRFWITVEGESCDANDLECLSEPTVELKAKMVIYEGKSETYPDGIFTLHFQAVPETQSALTPNIMNQGSLQVYKNTDDDIMVSFMHAFSFVGMTESFQQKVVMRRDLETGVGQATLMQAYPKWDGKSITKATEQMSLAYNSRYLLEASADENLCFDRDNQKTNAHRYGLYNNQGERISLQTGMALVHDQTDSYTDPKIFWRGWAGHWGLHFEPRVDGTDLQLTNGMTVKAFDHETRTVKPESYTVDITPGKLIKYTKDSIDMDDLKHLDLKYWSCAGGDCKNSKVIWNGSALKVRSIENQSGSDWGWNDLTTPTAFDFSSLESQSLHFHSEVNGAEIYIEGFCSGSGWVYSNQNNTWACAAEDIDFSQASVILAGHEVIMPGSNDALSVNDKTLVCYDRCPKPSGLGQKSTAYYDDNQAHYYTFNAMTMSLKENSSNLDVVLPENTDVHSIWSGTMFETTDNNYRALECQHPDDSVYVSTYTSTSSTSTSTTIGICAWKAPMSLGTVYYWETGKSPWSKIVSLVDQTSTTVEFDSPYRVEYTHESSKYQLRYEGFGRLEGFPYHCENLDTGKQVSCKMNLFEDKALRWVKSFNIPAGTVVDYHTKNSQGAAQAVVKALEEEVMYHPADVQACQAAGLQVVDYTSSLPTLNQWVDPSVIGAAPTTGLEVKVVVGDLKEIQPE
jgi:hypothetical protein